MTKHTTKKPAPTKDAGNALKVTAEAGVDEKAMMAKVALRPSIRAAVATRGYSKSAFGELDLTAVANELGVQITAVQKGDMHRPEAMLIAQAHTLEAIFYELVRRSGLNMGEYLQTAEIYMHLALRAQNQCRTTLQTLAVMKKPPASIAFVRQSNIAHGPQQVNNGTPESTCQMPIGTESLHADNLQMR